MVSSRGGKRPGAGRPKGAKNRRTLAVEELLEELDFDPIEAMVSVYRQAQEEGDTSLAGAMAKELAQYKYPKRRSVVIDSKRKGKTDIEILIAAK